MVTAFDDRDELYSTPDGQDVTKKLWIATKLTGAASLGIATIDVFLYSHPKTYLQTLGRYAYFSIPMVGISSAFVIITGITANIREKDDMVNSLVGGIAAGSVFGAWRRSTPLGFVACVAFSALGMLKKHAVLNGWTLMDIPIKLQPGGLRSVKTDWSLIKHRPGNWTTGKSD